VEDYLEVNLANWDERAPAHAASPGYDVENLVSGARQLSHVVAFDAPLLGDIAGLNGLHMQCHIGTDTLSLARLGARMTGLDFSPAALGEARRIAQAAGEQIDFVQSDVYSAVPALEGRTFELLYTGVGALCWLPQIARWAEIVAQLLAPGGRLFIREGHPMLWSIDDKLAAEQGLIATEYPYFEREQPNVWDEPGTYVPTETEFVHNHCVDWNHGLGEIITALLEQGLQLTGFVEHESVPWDALPGRMREIGDREYQLADRPWRLAHSYTLQAVRPG